MKISNRFTTAVILAFAVLFLPQNLQAGLIAAYNFTDGNLLNDSSGSATTYNLTQGGSGAVTLNPAGYAVFPGNDVVADQAYLEKNGPGGKPAFTVSFWWRTDDLTQGNFQGLFSNNDSGGANFSWQLDSHEDTGDLRLVSSNGTLTSPLSNLSENTWYHTVIRKVSGSSGKVYVTEFGAATVNEVMSGAFNFGGLQKFRLGVNRNSDSLFRMDMGNVQIYDDASVNLNSLLAQGPVPEPTAATLWSIVCFGMLFRRSRSGK